jgi:hypothetical protein
MKLLNLKGVVAIPIILLNEREYQQRPNKPPLGDFPGVHNFQFAEARSFLIVKTRMTQLVLATNQMVAY